MDMRIVHEGDAGHRVAEYVVRLRDESGHHHGVKGVDGGFEFGFGLNLHFHVNHLLARASGGNTAKLEPVIGDRCAEGQPHLIVEHEFFHNVSCTCTRRQPAYSRDNDTTAMAEVWSVRSQPTHIFRQSADMHRPALGRTVFSPYHHSI